MGQTRRAPGGLPVRDRQWRRTLPHRPRQQERQRQSTAADLRLDHRADATVKRKHDHPKLLPVHLYNSLYLDRSAGWFDNPWSHVGLALLIVALGLILSFILGGNP